MQIETTTDEIVIRIPSYMLDTQGLQMTNEHCSPKRR